MSSYATTRDAIYAELISVEGIGRVFKSPRYVSEWKSFLERFSTQAFDNPEKTRIIVAWMTRGSSFEIASKDESEITGNIKRTETWNITLFYGFDDDEEQPSEFEFQELIERVQGHFEFLDRITGIVETHSVDPIDIQSAGIAMINNEVLAHRADFILRINYSINTP